MSPAKVEGDRSLKYLDHDMFIISYKSMQRILMLDNGFSLSNGDIKGRCRFTTEGLFWEFGNENLDKFRQWMKDEELKVEGNNLHLCDGRLLIPIQSIVLPNVR